MRAAEKTHQISTKSGPGSNQSLLWKVGPYPLSVSKSFPSEQIAYTYECHLTACYYLGTEGMSRLKSTNSRPHFRPVKTIFPFCWWPSHLNQSQIASKKFSSDLKKPSKVPSHQHWSSWGHIKTMFGKSNKSTNWRYSKDQLKMHQVIYSVGCGVHFSKPNNIGKSLEEKVNSLCAGQVMLFESCSGKNVKSLEDFFFSVLNELS